MTPELAISLLAVVLSAGATIYVAIASSRDKKTERRETAEESVRRTREPLSYAAGDLQSRVWNILSGNITELGARNDDRIRSYLVMNTAFVLGQYMAWVELMRRRVMLAGGATGSTELRAGLDAVQKALADPSGASDFMLQPGEQRAIGELLLHSSGEESEPQVMGYAAFVARWRGDAEFRAWFDPISKGIGSVLTGTFSTDRLQALQHALILLIGEVDPRGHYTALNLRARWEPIVAE